MNNLIDNILQAEETNVEEEKRISSLIRYERAISDLFKELGLKPNLCQLLRAFIIASKGQTFFEASFSDLGKILYKIDSNNWRSVKSKIRYVFNTLESWQKENQLELIEVVKKGCRIKTDNGRFEYEKTQYKFGILAELIKILYSESEDTKLLLPNALSNIKAQYQPVQVTKIYHPLHKIKKDKKTIYTKLKTIYELSSKAGLNPKQYCKKLIDQCNLILSDLNDEYKEKENREDFIKRFEKLIDIQEQSIHQRVNS